MHLENENFEDFPSKPIESDKCDSGENMICSSNRKVLIIIAILLIPIHLIGLIFFCNQLLFNNTVAQPNDDSKLNGGFKSNYGSHPNNYYQLNDDFLSILKMANLGSEKFSLLKIPAISELKKIRFAIRNLKVTMEKSRVIIEHSKPTSIVLDELEKNIHDSVDELRNFQHKAEWFFWYTLNEMKAIVQEFEKLHLFDYEIDNDSSIHKRLQSLENQINEFHNQFQRISYSIRFVQKSAIRTREHLVEVKREAEDALNADPLLSWMKKLMRNFTNTTDPMINELEEELNQVNFIKKMLEEFDRDFIDFDDFLSKYRTKIREVTVQTEGVPKKPNSEAIDHLNKAVADLDKQHSKIFCKESIGHESKQ